MRELDNLVERLVVCWPPDADALSEVEAAQCLQAMMPELNLLEGADALRPPSAWRAATSARTLQSTQRHLARDHILATVADCGGDKAEACKRLGISRTTLWRRLREP